MKTEDFNIKFKEKIISGKAKLFFNGNPIRVICWDRKGLYQFVGLMSKGGLETIVEFDTKGTIHIPASSIETITNEGLYVEYDPIGISKQARVVYSLLRIPCIERYMKKYGYVEDEEKGWHWNAVEFANKYAKAFTNELHKDLKDNNEWKYDDDYDWE